MKYLQTYNESLRDQMSPKSDEEIDELWKDISDQAAKNVMEWDTLSYVDALNLVRKNKKKVIIMKNDGWPYDLIGHELLWPDKIEESLRDEMKPKSDEEMKNIVKNYNLKQKKQFLFKLYKSGFSNDKYKFYNYIRLMLGISVWNRILKQIKLNPSKVNVLHVHPMEFIDVFNKYEVDKLIELLLNMDKKTNESIRDRMSPKSKEEILSSLDGDPNATFKKVNRDMLSSWMIGEINTTYDDLVKLFGKPKEDDWIGNNFIWVLKTNNNRLISIYDNNSGLDKDEMKDISYKWHIGGTVNQDANDLVAYIMKNTI